jgi:hypothetical protein
MLIKRLSFLLCLSLLSSIGYSQTTIAGTVYDKKTGMPAPYVTVNLKTEQVYSRADEEGTFKIYSVKNIASDTLIFTSIGFLSTKLAVSDLKGPLKIGLIEDVKQLKEVSISNREMILGKYTKSKYKPTLGTAMITRRFKKTDDFEYLKRIVIWRKTDKLSGKKKTRYRIKIFNSKDSYGPPNGVVYEQILVDDTNQAELVIDLTKYHILLPTNHFFVGIERLATKDGALEEPRVNTVKDRQYSWVKMFGESEWKNIFIKPAITATVM